MTLFLLWLLRPSRIALLLLLVAGVVAGIVYSSWITAQARAVVVLSTVVDTPVLTWATNRLTDEPRIQEITVAGAPATLARPGEGDGPWPAIVFINGATELGRKHPDVQRLARGLARAGHVVLVPDLAGLVTGEMSDATVATTLAVAREFLDRRDVRDDRLAFVAVSLGTTVSLLAAEHPTLARRVSTVSGIAGYADLVNVARLATTGYYRQGNLLIRYRTGPFLAIAVARSLAAALPPSPERSLLVSELAEVRESDADPFAVLRQVPTSQLSSEARSVVALLLNRDPRKFDALYAALPVELKETIARLSPITNAHRLEARAELASAPRDPYFPSVQLSTFAEKAPDARVTVTQAFSHVVPIPSLSDPGDLLRFNGWAVRSLRSARG